MEDEWTEYTGVENFRGRADVRRIRVAPHVTEIPEAAFGQGAFASCTGLREVDLSNATKIGEHAFERCVQLREVHLSNVTEIGERAFQSCTGLRNITLRHVTTIGPGAFCDCHNLKTVELHEGLRTISQGAFCINSELKSVAIPSTVTEIGGSAFSGCFKLEAVTLCEGLRVINKGAFFKCRKLESVVIPSTVTEIRERAFRFCSELASVELLGGIQTIDQNTFPGCPSFERITIPSPAFVISAGGTDNNLRCHLSSDATIPMDSTRMVVSRHVKHMSPSNLEEAGRKINEILGRHEDDVMQDRREQWQEQIRKLFAYYELLDATTLLELAIWKATMDQSAQFDGGDVEEKSQKRARVDLVAHRIQCRNDSGAHTILQCVLPYLGDLHG